MRVSSGQLADVRLLIRRKVIEISAQKTTVSLKIGIATTGKPARPHYSRQLLFERINGFFGVLASNHGSVIHASYFRDLFLEDRWVSNHLRHSLGA